MGVEKGIEVVCVREWEWGSGREMERWEEKERYASTLESNIGCDAL